MFVPRSIPATFLASLFVVGTATTAFADGTPATTTTEADGYGYKFNDDLLEGGGPSATGARIHVVPHAARNVLIRPRTQFIAEMLKSVENI